MFILRSIMATSPIMDLKSSANRSQASLNTAHADVAARASLYNMQKLLGEDPTKMDRVTTKTVVTSIFRLKRQIVTACANTSVLTHTLVDHDVVEIAASKAPFIHMASRKVPENAWSTPPSTSAIQSFITTHSAS